jgi:hypothetical protein
VLSDVHLFKSKVLELSETGPRKAERKRRWRGGTFGRRETKTENSIRCREKKVEIY